MIHPTLYNVDSKGKVRTWYLETDGGRYRSVSGLEGGKKVTSEWTLTEPKNVGRANATTAEEQALAEVKAHYKKKIEKKYSETKESAGGQKFTECMLAAKWKDLKAKNAKNPKKYPISWPVYSQPKLDGFRCLASEGSLLSRGGKQFPACVHILEALQPVFDMYPGIILDGELYNHELHDDFDRIGSVVRQMKPTEEDLENARKYVQYHVYDIAGGVEGNFSFRTVELEHIVKNVVGQKDFNDCIVNVWTQRCDDEDALDSLYFQDYLPHNYEGQMVRMDAPYEGGRSNSLLKRKEFEDAEFEVVSLEEGKGNWSGYAKAVYFRMPGDQRTKGGDYPKAGIKGSKEFAKRLLEGPLPRTVTVRYPNLTPEGVPRFPIAVDFQGEEGRVD